MLQKADLKFDPPLEEFLRSRDASHLTVLAGANNTGKSLTLKYVKAHLGKTAYMVGTNRIYHVYHFSTGLRQPSELDQWEQTFRSDFHREDYNYEQNYIDLNRVIINLGDTKRTRLFQICGELLDATFQLKKVDADNELSHRYIDMDGQNISVGSTGTRLLMTLLGICLDERFDTLLIDEPELGLSPGNQLIVSELFADTKRRDTYFPHLKNVFLATHSHLFLDRRVIANNFVVARTGAEISLYQTVDITEFHRLQFNLLGNRLEAMFFPSSVVVVEGKTDLAYLQRIVELHFGGRRIFPIGSEGDVKRKVHGLREAFGDIQTSPIRSRLFVVLDKVHQPSLCSELVAMGVLPERVVEWSRNGIEYVYPPSLIAEIYACSEEEVGGLELAGDKVTLNGITKTKNELCDKVCTRLTRDTVLPEELHERFLTPLSKAIE